MPDARPTIAALPATRVPTTIPAAHLPSADLYPADLPAAHISTANLSSANISTADMPTTHDLDSAATVPTTDVSRAAHHLAEAIWQVEAIAE